MQDHEIKLEYFLRHMKFRRMSPNTIESYSATIKQMFKYGLTDLESIDYLDIQTFFQYLNDKQTKAYGSPYKEATINQKINAIRSFLVYLYTYDYISNDIGDKIVIPGLRGGDPEIEVVEVDEYRKMVRSFSGKRNGFRDALIIEVFFNTGIRLGELIGLNNGDIKDNAIVIEHAKGNKRRVVYINSELEDRLNEYREIQRKKYIEKNGDDFGFEEDAFFKSERDNRISETNVQRIVNVGSEVLDKKVHPHMLRASYATHLVEAGVELTVIKDLMGHESIETTLKYIKVNDKRRKEAAGKFYNLQMKKNTQTTDDIDDIIRLLDKEKVLELLLRNLEDLKKNV